ncbi:MAG: hypothetical protein ACC608_06305 [Anaerofustis sp.]
MQHTDNLSQIDIRRADRLFREYLEDICCIGCQRRCNLRYHLCSVGFLESAKARTVFAEDNPLSPLKPSVAANAALHTSLVQSGANTDGSGRSTARCQGCAVHCSVNAPHCSHGGIYGVLAAKEF